MFDVKLNVEKLASFVSCDVLIVDVANEYVEPLAPTPRKPVDSDGSVSVPIVDRVEDEYVNDPRVVDEFPNVLSAVNVLDVYVLGIVVEAAMYELIALFCVVESIVRRPPTLDSPVPSSDVNDEPPRLKLVVDAVMNDAYVVDELENLFTPVKLLVSDRRVDEAAPVSDVRKPASLLNHDSFTDDEAIVETIPLLPVNAKPCDSPDR